MMVRESRAMADSGESQSAEKARLGRQVRIGVVRDLKKVLEHADGIILAKVEKVQTREVNQLRQALQGRQGNLLVVKNRLGRLALRDLGWGDMERSFEGTCGISPLRGDPTLICKLLNNFSKDHEGFILRGGIFKGQMLQPQDLFTLARLPSREVLLSRLAGMALSPIRTMAFLLTGPVQALALGLEGVKRKKEGATPQSSSS